MRRIHVLIGIGVLLAGAAIIAPDVSAGGAPRTTEVEPFCENYAGFCPDNGKLSDYEGNYVGHDEPSLLFYSDQPGSGNNTTWTVRLPHEAPVLPKQDGTGGTWNFQRSATFWFGMAMCESESYPNPGTPCTPDSDANIKASSDSSSPDWVGNHVGTGFMELQFYPPGWVPRARGLSCDATRWCAAMAVFGMSVSQTRVNNADCFERAGEEWANYAFITTDGHPQSPPDPLNATLATFTPDPAKALFMDPGDSVRIEMHDSAAGLVIQLDDLTTGSSGSMTASVANGFAHPLFEPDASTCTEEPYAFHPMYSTSSETTNVPWGVHSYNVSFSDEIGHFQRCMVPERTGAFCRVPGKGQAPMSENECYRASESLLVRIGGCRGEDFGFDGSSYLPGWSGTIADAAEDRQLHAESFQVTSPLTDGQNYPRTAFESNLPAIEHQFYGCADDGTGCVNPPPGAQFYPIYSTRGDGTGACAWQEGGTAIPGTTDTFGGTSTAEYGAQLVRYYPRFGGLRERFTVDDFRNVLPNNPCPNTGGLPAG